MQMWRDETGRLGRTSSRSGWWSARPGRPTGSYPYAWLGCATEVAAPALW